MLTSIAGCHGRGLNHGLLSTWASTLPLSYLAVECICVLWIFIMKIFTYKTSTLTSAPSVQILYKSSFSQAHQYCYYAKSVKWTLEVVVVKWNNLSCVLLHWLMFGLVGLQFVQQDGNQTTVLFANIEILKTYFYFFTLTQL